ncbi:lysozyme [Agrobacterium rosae]|uniref:lysozyme n=1 Tax=Agrobacterium rosae TaxID=1972867 RepID=UPI00122F205F|nr:lysozyme [Agrobacterium rosae]KAA3510085.1 glycoside hydrolase [Agrobacterium rosae]KAA3514970.1 glycoside hydrolase [Agrobacterium rosae]MQB50705.1 glycoside hydrolase [Agrobacterium rosae]
MPINKIAPTKRGKAAIATVLAGIAAGSYAAYDRYATYGKMDPAVILSVEKAIIPWEGLVLKSHWDQFAKKWDICHGETKGIGPGMTKTRAECKDMLLRRVHDDFYQVIVQCSPNLSKAPISVRASMISGSYNFGVGAWCRSTAKARIEAGQWRAACEAQTAFNRAGGQVVRGLVNRREMGDAQRIGEAELCVSGL